MRRSYDLTEKILRDNVISPEEAEVVRYGLEHMKSVLLGTLISVLTGIAFGSVQVGLLLVGFLFPLRTSAGGYHAATKGKCLWISIALVFGAFLFLDSWKCPIEVHRTVVIFGTLFTWRLAPVGTPNKLLDEVEKKVYGARTKRLLLADSVLFGLANWMDWRNVTTAIAMALFIAAILLVMGKMDIIRLQRQGQDV